MTTPHDHHHVEDLNTLVVSKALTAIDLQIKNNDVLGKNITAKVMQDIGTSLLNAAQTQFTSVSLVHAITVPVQFEDGSALFLFDQHYAHNGLNNLLLVQYPDNWDQQALTVKVSVIKVNEGSLKDSHLSGVPNTHKAEIVRQIYASKHLQVDRFYSLVYLRKEQIPTDFVFFIPPAVEETKIQEDVEFEPESLGVIDDGAFSEGKRILDPQLQRQLDVIKRSGVISDVSREPHLTSVDQVLNQWIVNGLTLEAAEPDQIDLSQAVIAEPDSKVEAAPPPTQEEANIQLNWQIAPQVVREYSVIPAVPEGQKIEQSILQQIADNVTSEVAYIRACGLGFVGNHDHWKKFANIVLYGLLGDKAGEPIVQTSQEESDDVKLTASVAEQFPTFTPDMQSLVKNILKNPLPFQPTLVK